MNLKYVNTNSNGMILWLQRRPKVNCFARSSYERGTFRWIRGYCWWRSIFHWAIQSRSLDYPSTGTLRNCCDMCRIWIECDSAGANPRWLTVAFDFRRKCLRRGSAPALTSSSGDQDAASSTDTHATRSQGSGSGQPSDGPPLTRCRSRVGRLGSPVADDGLGTIDRPWSSSLRTIGRPHHPMDDRLPNQRIHRQPDVMLPQWICRMSPKWTDVKLLEF